MRTVSADGQIVETSALKLGKLDSWSADSPGPSRLIPHHSEDLEAAIQVISLWIYVRHKEDAGPVGCENGAGERGAV